MAEVRSFAGEPATIVAVTSSYVDPSLMGGNAIDGNPNTFWKVDKVIVYPNPAAGRIYFNVDNRVEVKVCTLEGKLLISASDVDQLDISGLTNGAYLVIIEDNTTSTRQLILVNN